MPKTDDLQKVTIRLRAGDWERLRNIFPRERSLNRVIRRIISNYVDKHDKQIEPEEIEELASRIEDH